MTRVIPSTFRPPLERLPIDEATAKRKATEGRIRPISAAVAEVMRDILAVLGSDTLTRPEIIDKLPYNNHDTIRYALRRLQESGQIHLHTPKAWRKS